MLSRLEPFAFDNSTAESRLRGELSYIQQELEAGRLPIPGPNDITSTTRYIASEWQLDDRVGDYYEVKKKLYHIDSLIICEGLVKARHYPRLIELCDLGVNTMEDIQQREDAALSQAEHALMDAYISDLRGIARSLYRGVDDIFELTRTCQNFYRSQIPDLVFRTYVIESDHINRPFKNEIRGAIGSQWRPLQPRPTPAWEMPEWVAAD